MTKSLSILFLATALAFVGCKKKEEAAGAGSATKPAETAAAAPSAAAPAATTPPATTPATTPAAAPTAATTPAAPAAGDIASDDDYIAKSTGALDKLTTVFKADGTDCDKLAGDLSKFADETAGTIKSIKAYEKAHPEVQKKLDEASKGRMTAFQETAGPALTACQSNKKVADAMAKMSED